MASRSALTLNSQCDAAGKTRFLALGTAYKGHQTSLLPAWPAARQKPVNVAL